MTSEKHLRLNMLDSIAQDMYSEIMNINPQAKVAWITAGTTRGILAEGVNLEALNDTAPGICREYASLTCAEKRYVWMMMAALPMLRARNLVF